MNIKERRGEARDLVRAVELLVVALVFEMDITKCRHLN